MTTVDATRPLPAADSATVVGDRARIVARSAPDVPPRVADAGWLLGLAALLLVGRELGDLELYRVGLVVIAAISVLGLHVLVNWTGQLSLAQSAFVGVPAFAAARVGIEYGWPVTATLVGGVVLGATMGAFVALPALRVRGIQVAVVTLLFGVAVQEFVFRNPSFTGSTVLAVPDATILGRSLTSSHELFPLLVAGLGAALWATRRIERSAFGRGLRLVRESDRIAEAAGVAAHRYKIAAYAYAGALAGLAAVLGNQWIGRVGPSSFTTAASLLVLTCAVVGGPGSLLGPILATVALTASELPAWVAPAALLLVVTKYPAGLNGLGRHLRTRLSRRPLERPS